MCGGAPYGVDGIQKTDPWGIMEAEGCGIADKRRRSEIMEAFEDTEPEEVSWMTVLVLLDVVCVLLSCGVERQAIRLDTSTHLLFPRFQLDMSLFNITITGGPIRHRELRHLHDPIIFYRCAVFARKIDQLFLALQWHPSALASLDPAAGIPRFLRFLC